MQGCLKSPAAAGIVYLGPGLLSSSILVTGLPFIETAGALNEMIAIKKCTFSKYD